jgi:hypothetical protein
MLADVITAVRARLAAAGVSTPLLLGKTHLKRHGEGGDRLVIIPNDDQFGAGATQDFNGPGGGPRNKPLITRMAGAEVHVWGVPPNPKAPNADLDAQAAAETLLHAFIRELRNECRGQWKAVSGRWNNEIADLVYGAEYILQVTVDVPVVAVAKRPLPQGTTITTTTLLGNTSEEV